MHDRVRFGLGLLLTVLAGWVDSIGFISLGGFYVSFMSGNTTQFGIGLARFDVGLIPLPAILLGCFVLGAFIGTILSSLSEHWTLPVIMLVEGLLLGCALLLAIGQPTILGVPEPLAIAMGAQNAALRNDRGHRVGGTFVTGTVFGLGEQLALWCLGKGGVRPVARHALGWAALAAGAALGAFAYGPYGFWSLSVPAACFIILAVVTATMTMLRSGRVLPQERTNEAP